MQTSAMEMIKPGVLWDDIHIHVHKILIKGLLRLGILHNGTVDEILESRTSVAFLPHGLGHFMGMDTHDSGGHPNYKDEDPMFRYLRCRIPLKERHVITVEPGCYFCEFIIEPYLKDENHSKYINKEVLEKYWDVGGVRIEDGKSKTRLNYVDSSVLHELMVTCFQ
jgi:Xaa-Pro dipeptidase